MPEQIRLPEWRTMVDFITATYSYGDRIAHAALGASCDLDPASPVYYQAVARSRRALLVDHRIVLQNDRGVGYVLTEPSGFFAVACHHATKAGRRIRLAITTLIAAPQELLSDGENRRNADAAAKLGALETNRRRTLTEVKKLPTTPPPDVPKMLPSKGAKA